MRLVAAMAGLFMLSSGASMHSVGATSMQVADDDVERIEFAPGTDFASVAGTVGEDVPVTYVLNAGDSRTMVIALASVNASASLTVTDPNGEVMAPGPSVAFSAPLESGMGDYTIEVSSTEEIDSFGMTVYIPAPASSGDGTASSVAPIESTTTAAPVAPTTATPDADDDGGMNAGAPQFTSFEVSSPVPCQDGNASVTMSYDTVNAEMIAIKVGDGDFEETAGYGPSETGVVASIPCSGAATSSIQLRACTPDGECADSEVREVDITG